MTGIKGIHHITGIAGDPQKNVDFYTGVLGLRMVKKTVNFDDPHTYHLYFGDEYGSPGSIITFFPWGNRGLRGSKGTRQITATGYSISSNSVEFWKERLNNEGIIYNGPFSRFNNTVITFEDHDGFEIELIADKEEKRKGWDNGIIPGEHSIKGFHSATASYNITEETIYFLTEVLGFREGDIEGNRRRFILDSGAEASALDILTAESAPGRMGAGAVHHIAWRIENDEEQKEIRDYLLKKGVNVTEVMNRNYFKSIYFREPGGVLFEIATDPPGFLIDEAQEELGMELKLPPWQEVNRKEIEEILPELKVRESK
jgi:glyoxalase family protein